MTSPRLKTHPIRGLLLLAAAACLCGAIPDADAQTPATIFGNCTLERDKEQAFTVERDTIPAGDVICLRVLARLDTPAPAGYTPALVITVNGTVLMGSDRFVNRPLRAKMRDGRIMSMAGGERISVFYSPDFQAADAHPHYGRADNGPTGVIQLRITDLLRPGSNELIFAHRADVDNPLVMADAVLEACAPDAKAAGEAGPPEGPLPRIEPRAGNKLDFSVAETGPAAFSVSVGGVSFPVTSTFSTPDGGWASESNAWFKHERAIEQTAEAVTVRDTFENLTDEILPLIQRHELAHETRPARVWIGGIERPLPNASDIAPNNPTVFAALGQGGAGFLATGDVARIHAENYVNASCIGLADRQCALPPHGRYTAEWAFLPTAQPDYWAFINACRRLINANYPIDGAFAFLRADSLTDVWTDEQIRSFLTLKDARYACASITYPRYNGHYSHGTSFQRVTHDNYRASIARWRSLAPETKSLVYFHCYIDVTEDGPNLFPEARLLLADGTHAAYDEDYYRIYVPLDSNSYGPAVAKNVDIIFDEIGADGVYWDEHEYSRYLYHYGEPWDNCSADIDPNTHQVVRLKSSVTLLTEPWRLALAKRILARGPLVGNGVPYTRAMAALGFPCFVETGSISNCTQAHLYTPIALGDHLTERSEIDAYRTMLAALDYGCVYHWYNDVDVVPTHPHLTRYMYPITPLELHEGYIIGRERIVTRVSGLFGWGDASQHEVHIFDDQGREMEGVSAPLVEIDGKTCSEVRLGKDWSAAIVRK